MEPATKNAAPAFEYLKLNGHIGAENAIKMERLGMKLHMKPREVRRQVNEERKNGKLIAPNLHGTLGGYYLPRNMEEIIATYKTLRSKAVNEWKIVAVFRRAIKEPPQDLLGNWEVKEGVVFNGEEDQKREPAHGIPNNGPRLGE